MNAIKKSPTLDSSFLGDGVGDFLFFIFYF